MSNKQLTIKINKTADGCYVADIAELNDAVVLAESLEDLFDAIQSTIEVCDEVIKTPVKV